MTTIESPAHSNTPQIQSRRRFTTRERNRLVGLYEKTVVVAPERSATRTKYRHRRCGVGSRGRARSAAMSHTTAHWWRPNELTVRALVGKHHTSEKDDYH